MLQVFKDFKNICDLHNVLGLRLQKTNQSFSATHGNDVSTLIQTTKKVRMSFVLSNCYKKMLLIF